MGPVGWLNDNAGAVQAVATVVLVVLTARYVSLTRSLARAAEGQIKLIEEQRGREARAARGFLHNSATRLLDELGRLPARPSGSDKERTHPGWSSSQLADFVAYAREVSGVDEGRAMDAVSALNRINHSLTQTKGVSVTLGRNFSEPEVASWEADMALARSVLQEIISQTNAEGAA